MEKNVYREFIRTFNEFMVEYEETINQIEKDYIIEEHEDGYK